MIKKISSVLVAVGLVLTVAPAVQASSVGDRPAVVSVPASKGYTTRQKNQYWNAVRRLEPDARIVGKKSVIEMGVSVCGLLRAGGTLRDLASLVMDADPIVEDLLMASIAAAPIYLCRDQQYKFD
jgi:hypothetical protein